MNWVDIIIVIILIVGFAKGIGNGFVRGLFGLIALVLGIIVASTNYQQISELLLYRLPGGERLQDIIAFMLVFLIVLIVVSLIGNLVSKAFKLAALGWLDRLAGAFLGVFVSCLFVGFLLILVVIAGFHETNGVRRSTVAPVVVSVLDTAVAFAPQGVRDAIDEHYVKLRVEWEKARREPPEEEEEEEGETTALLPLGPPTLLTSACALGAAAPPGVPRDA